MRHKSIGKQLFCVTMLLIIGSFILAGTLLYNLMGSYLSQRYVRNLENIAGQMADITVYLAETDDRLSENTFKRSVKTVANSTNTTIFISNTDGKLIAVSDDQFSGSVPKNLLKEALRGNTTVLRGSLGGMFRDSAVTVVKPLLYRGQTMGIVFVSVSSPELVRMRTDIFKIFVYTVVALAVIVAVISYFYSKHLTKPIVQFNEVAKAIAAGDLSRRVSIDAENEFTELGESFNRMTESIEQLEKMRSGFVANVSHDLRTPMTTIIGFVQGILDGTIPPEKHEWYLSIVLDESKRLSRIVTDLLDISKLEQGSFHLDKRDFDINELVRLHVIKLEKRITEKNIRLTVDFANEFLMVHADKDAISRVLTNLIDNAIKFTQEGGSIDISAGIRNAKAYVSVQNSGEGICKEDLMHVFDRFYKTDKSRSLNKNGAGLGLYIVKSLVSAHGESVWAESERDEFARFTFTLEIGNMKLKDSEHKG